MRSSRRVFLSTILSGFGAAPAAALGQGGLDQFAASGPPCSTSAKTTPAVPRDATFRTGSPRRASLIEPGGLGTRLTLSGTVAGVTCGRIAGAVIDFWQPDSHGRYDVGGFLLRGHQLTDARGNY